MSRAPLTQVDAIFCALDLDNSADITLAEFLWCDTTLFVCVCARALARVSSAVTLERLPSYLLWCARALVVRARSRFVRFHSWLRFFRRLVTWPSSTDSLSTPGSC